MTSAANTKIAVMSFRSFGFSPHRSAMATSSRNSTDPMTVPAMSSPTARVPTSASPMMTLARPRTTIPDAHLHVGEALILRDQRAASATKPFDSARPKIVSVSTLTPSAQIICGLSPVARIAVPRCVWKKA